MSRALKRPGFSLYPDFIFNELTEITPQFLSEHGVVFLMADLDNTIASYDEKEPSDDVLDWFETLKEGGILSFIISNSRRVERVEMFAKALDLEYVMYAKKPSPDGLLRAMGMAGHTREQTALVGDQIFTDVLAANRAGIKALLVHPRRFTNPFLKLRYYIEKPFRRT